MTTTGPPGWVDADSGAYWRALAERRVVAQKCEECLRQRLPLMPSCPYCGAVGSTLVDLSGQGVLYSRVRVHYSPTPEFAADVPYTLAAVLLDGGPRVFARVTDGANIGQRVTALFVDHEGWTELRFEIDE